MTKVCNIADQHIQNLLYTGTSAPFNVQLTKELKTDYKQLNKMFLINCNMSLEIIFVMRIVEKVKEMLVYTEQSISQIAKALSYRKPTKLSEQLMTYTGLTSAHYKQIRRNKLEIIRKRQESQNEL
jgi:methylphosphotriester-DNA--protein-cysteine methyltransferase